MVGVGRRGFVVALAVAFASGALGCGHETPAKRVRLVEPPRDSEDGPPEARREVLRVGIGSVLTRSATLHHYRDLVDYMGERLGVATETVQRPSNAELNEMLRRRYCTVAFVCNYAYVRARDEFGAEAIASPVVSGDATYRAYVIVAKNAPARSLLDLAGRRFAFADPLCNAGWLYPSYRLLQLQQPHREFFGSEIFTHDYESSIRAVAEQAADGAGVEAPLYDSLVAEENPAALATRIVDRSPPFGTPPVVVHPRMDPALRQRVHDFLLTLHDDERGREILHRIQIDRFVETDPTLYAPVRAMADAIDRQ